MSGSSIRSNPLVHIAAVLLIGIAIGLAYHVWFRNGQLEDLSVGNTSGAGIGINGDPPAERVQIAEPEPEPEPDRVAAEPSKNDAAATPSAKIAAIPEADSPESTAALARDLSISGRVLNRRGDPVSGIQITARRFDPSTNRFSSVQNSAHSLAEGRYAINGLTAGDYQLRTTLSDRYTSATIFARAGFKSADIVLNDGHQVRVIGTVTDAAGYPVAGVAVIPSQSAGRTTTDKAGSYETTLTTQRNRTYSFRFQAPGYTDAVQSFSGADVLRVREKRLDAQLSPAGNSEVNGTVTNDFGTVVVGARIWVNSPSLKTSYQATSDRNGFYVMSGIIAGSDYQLTVNVRGLYEQYIRKPVAITDGGVTLDITLTSLAGGRVTGNMVDARGEPVPSFTLLLISSKAAGRTLPVVGDSAGYFEVDQVPEGRLTFVTRSQPRVSIRGAQLPATGEVFVRLVIDWGVHDLVGQVTDISGNPIPGVDAALTWHHAAGSMQSSSSRRSLTDAGGFFRFTQLGPGMHRLDLMAKGFRRYSTNVDVGGGPGELSIQLHSDS
jgi:hypothetical protein